MEPSDFIPTSLPPRTSRKKWLIEQVTSLGTALIIVFAIRSSVVEAFKIPSGSMIPTLHVGDHIFVNKFAYGFKVPFSDWISNDPIFITDPVPPKRGDIVVFKYPKDENIYYIKRVVGLPGDAIELKNRVLHVNGKPQEWKSVAAPQTEAVFKDVADEKYTPHEIDLAVEDLDGQKHWIFSSKINPQGENFGPVSVPDGRFFVMGDNRDFSNDSRYWGFVPAKNVKGRAMVIWLSIWLGENYQFQPERIGTILHKEPQVD